ncbi:hypothetical protein MNBD_BACTEROID01-1457 [hydrothermal vent metagenome]|uniref:Uncharacterized protein n=1 Tax=hydrothermal vent metagenome TaxID=652676 RepID=A0A3B0TQ34_9ZZZZ
MPRVPRALGAATATSPKFIERLKELHLKVEEGLVVNHKIVENEVPEVEDNGLPF